MTDTKKDEIITLAEASAILGLHPNTLRKWDNSGFLKAIRYGTRKDRRYRKSDIMKVLKQK
jgi:DNA-binding transcriptional MerR regulator